MALIPLVACLLGIGRLEWIFPAAFPRQAFNGPQSRGKKVETREEEEYGKDSKRHIAKKKYDFSFGRKLQSSRFPKIRDIPVFSLH
jgi:hypothetical protein